MSRTVKRLLLLIAALVVLVAIGTVVYVYVWDQADEEIGRASCRERV